MECVGQLRLPQPYGLLGVPAFNPLNVDEEESDVVIAFRPKTSPLPRRKSSISDEGLDEGAPPCGSRRVSFADAKGLSLVEVKEFETWDGLKLPGRSGPESNGAAREEYHLSPLTFPPHLSSEEVLPKVLKQKVELESVELLSGTTVLKGVIRVLNVSYSKEVYIRTTLDQWTTHFDLLAEYMPGSSDGVTDCFSFRLTLVLPHSEQSARVDFCLRYETPDGTFWANNGGKNYVLFCHKRVREETSKPQREYANVKSCLKSNSQILSTPGNFTLKQESSQETMTSEKCQIPPDSQSNNDGRSGSSADEKRKLMLENRQNRMLRRRRKTERMDRVRSYFAQRDREGDDTNGGETTSETKQEAEVEISVCDSSKVCAEVFEANSKHDHDGVLEASSLPAEKQSTVELVTEPERISESEVTCGSVTIAEGETDADQSHSFTFTTVVAPLYQQVFSKLGGESESTSDEVNEITTIDVDSSDSGKLDQGVNELSPAEAQVSDQNSFAGVKPHLLTSMRNVDEGIDFQGIEMSNLPNVENVDHLQEEGAQNQLIHGRQPIEWCFSHTDVTFTDKTAQSGAQEGQQEEPMHNSTTPPSVWEATGDELVEIANSLDFKNVNCLVFTINSGPFDSIAEPENLDLTPEINLKTQKDDFNKHFNEHDPINPYEDDVEDSLVISFTYEEHESEEQQLKGSQSEDTLEDTPENSCPCSKMHEENGHFPHLNVMKSWERMVEEEEERILESVKVGQPIVPNVESHEAMTEEEVEVFLETTVDQEVKRQNQEDVSASVNRSSAKEDLNKECKIDCVIEKMTEDPIGDTIGGRRQIQEEHLPVKEKHFVEESQLSANWISGQDEEGTEKEKRVKFEEDSKRQDEGEDQHSGDVRENPTGEGERGDMPVESCKEEAKYWTSDEAGESFVAAACLEGDKNHDPTHQYDDGSPIVSDVISLQPPANSEFPYFQDEKCSAKPELTAYSSAPSDSDSNSDSDDEVELYMYRLKAAGAAASINKEEAAFSVSKRPSVSRSRPPPPAMSPIRESADEEQHVCGPPDNRGVGSTPSPNDNPSASWWKTTLSCGNVVNVLLCSALLVGFLVVAHRYDFLACFGLYLVSVVWLWSQGEKEPSPKQDRAAKQHPSY